MVIWEKNNSPNLPYVWKVIPQLNGECKRKSTDAEIFFRVGRLGRTQTSCQTASMTLWCASLLNARDRQMTV